MSNESIEDRLSALEGAVAQLSVVPAKSTEPDSPLERMNEMLWALNGLERRIPDGGIIYTGSVQTPAGALVRWQYGQTGPDIFAENWGDHAERLAALGNPIRLRILQAVLNGSTSAAQLAEEIDAGTSGQVYHHLKELTAVGWLASPKRGLFDVPASRVVPLLAILVASGTPQA